MDHIKVNDDNRQFSVTYGHYEITIWEEPTAIYHHTYLEYYEV